MTLLRVTASTFGGILMLSGALAEQHSHVVFRSGAQLMEIDVVVRDKNGPVRNLTNDDFALYDCISLRHNCKGARRNIDLFREVNSLAIPSAPPLPPGAVSNRVRPDGEPAPNDTVVLFDQLDTPFDLKGYERSQLVRFLSSIGDGNRIALYSLGNNLHLVQDFTDDPKKMIDAVARIDSGDWIGFAQHDDPGYYFNLMQEAYNFPPMEDRIGAVSAMKARIVQAAIQVIARHMDGVSGRKNLIWIGQDAPVPGAILGRANIAVYPVKVRTLLGNPHLVDHSLKLPRKAALNPRFAIPLNPPGDQAIEMHRANQRLGEGLGGEGFDDVADSLTAVKRAEEDSSDYYVLGFYPAEAELTGKTHQLTLEVSSRIPGRRNLTVQYRQEYLGDKEVASKATLADLFVSPLNANAIGLTALIEPDPLRASQRQIRATIDLRDVQFQHDGDRWNGSIEVSLGYETKPNSMTTPLARKLDLSFSDAEFQKGRASGLEVTYPLPPEARSGSARIVAEDLANGAVGSLRVPIQIGLQKDTPRPR